jgi:drug/metabolite transporter (DMT)-like permease
MSTDSRFRPSPLLAAALGLGVLALVVAVGVLLREHGPGNMGNGFLQGAAVGLVGVAVVAWRVSKRPDRTTTFERAWTQTGDERDDAVLTRALAVLGILAFPLTAAAAIAIALGAEVEMVLALLLFAEVVVGALAFVVINRRN